MSSSDPQAVSAWALDELDVPDVFTPLGMGGHGAAFGGARGGTPGGSYDGSPAREETPEEAAMRAVVAERVAEEVARVRAGIEADAFARGQASAMADAAEQAQSQVARVLDALLAATASVRAHEQRWLGNVEENLAAIAVTVARHLIQRELAVDKSVLSDLITRSLQQFPLEHRITVRLHPEDHAVVQELLATGQVDGTADREIRWQADPHVTQGGCLVEGRERVLDGRLDTALERAYRTLGQVQA